MESLVAVLKNFSDIRSKDAHHDDTRKNIEIDRRERYKSIIIICFEFRCYSHLVIIRIVPGTTIDGSIGNWKKLEMGCDYQIEMKGGELLV
jgi:hypothetical protein